MKHPSSFLSLTIAASLLISCSPHKKDPKRSSRSDWENPSRGIDIHPAAHECSFQDLGVISKAQHYRGLCSSLTEAEYCLAFIKAHMNDEHQIEETRHKEHAKRCLDVFSKNLGIP